MDYSGEDETPQAPKIDVIKTSIINFQNKKKLFEFVTLIIK
jgi:hypothetical protein